MANIDWFRDITDWGFSEGKYSGRPWIVKFIIMNLFAFPCCLIGGPILLLMFAKRFLWDTWWT